MESHAHIVHCYEEELSSLNNKIAKRGASCSHAEGVDLGENGSVIVNKIIDWNPDTDDPTGWVVFWKPMAEPHSRVSVSVASCRNPRAAAEHQSSLGFRQL